MNLWKFVDSDQYITEEYPSWQIDESTAGTTYIRWEDSAKAQFIEKVIESAGITTIGFAVGLWTGRAGLTYVSRFALRG